MALREILAKFGFDFDKSKLKEINGQVENTSNLLKTAVGAFLGHALFHGIESFIENITETGAALKNLEEQTNMTAENIQLFQYGAGLSGIATEEWDAAIRKLSLSLGKAGDGSKEQAGAFQELGIATQNADGSARSLNDVLPEIVASMGDIDDTSKRARLSVDLFGRAGTKLVGFLGEGAEGLVKLKAEFDELGGGFSEEAITDAHEYHDNLLRIGLAVKSLKSTFATDILPILSEIAINIAKLIGHGRRFIQTTNLAKGAMIALGIAGVAGISALLSPFLPVIAAVTTLSLLLDDLVSFLNGEDSVLGDLLNKMLGAGGAEKVRGYLQDLSMQVKTFFEDIIQHPKKFFEEMDQMYKQFLKDHPFLARVFGDGDSSQESQFIKKKSDFELATTSDEVLQRQEHVDTANRIFGPLPTGQGTAAPNGYTDTGEKKADDWFSRLANNLFGGNVPTMGAVPALATTAAVPGQEGAKIDQQNRVNITVQAGTPDETTRAVEQGATNALGNERRAALAALEQNR